MADKHSYVTREKATNDGYGFYLYQDYLSEEPNITSQTLFYMFNNKSDLASPAQWGERLAVKARLMGFIPRIPISIEPQSKGTRVSWHFKTLAERETFNLYVFGNEKKKGAFCDVLCPPDSNPDAVEFGLAYVHETCEELGIKPGFKFGNDNSLTLSFDSRADYVAFMLRREMLIDEIVGNWKIKNREMRGYGAFVSDYEAFREAKAVTQKFTGQNKGYSPT